MTRFRPRFSYPLSSALLIAVAMLPGCQREHPARPGEPVVEHVDGRSEVLIGPRTSKVLGDPTIVRAYRVMSPFAKSFEQFKKTKPLIDEYPILAEAPVQTRTAQKIANILLDSNSYDPAYAMACLFEPGHALRFERNSDIVDVIICFKCGDLNIQPAKAIGEQGTMQPFGKVAKPLYEAVQEIFPEPDRGSR